MCEDIHEIDYEKIMEYLKPHGYDVVLYKEDYNHTNMTVEQKILFRQIVQIFIEKRVIFR